MSDHEKDSASVSTRRRSKPRRRRRSKQDKHVPRDLYLALDGQFDGNSLSRVVIVNWDKQVILDIAVEGQKNGFVRRRKRLAVGNNSQSCSLLDLSLRVQPIVKGKVLVGYGLERMVHALDIPTPLINLRDCATYAPFMKEVADPLSVMLVPRTLQELADHFELPSSTMANKSMAQKAICCMDLYRRHRSTWESDVAKFVQQSERQRQMMERNRQRKLLSMIPEAEQNFAADADVETLQDSEERRSRRADHPPKQLELQPDEAYEAYQRVRSQSFDDSFEARGSDTNYSLVSSSRPRVSSIGDESWSSSAVSNSIWLRSVGDSGSSMASEEAWSNPGSTNVTQPFVNPRPTKESVHPVEIGDWLDEPVKALEDDNVVSGSKHLPSKLLSDSDDSSSEPAPRENSSHLVDGASEDWLDQEERRFSSPRRESWFRRRPPSSEKTEDSRVPSPHKFPFFRK